MTIRKSVLNSIIGGAVALVIVALLLSSAAYTVDQAEQAIIVQFGEPQEGLISEPGLHWKTPFIQEVRRFDKRLLSWDGNPNQIPTLGREFILVDTTARWLIEDPLMYLKTVRDEQGASTRLNDVIDAAVRNHISKTNLEEIVRSKDWKVDESAVDEILQQRDDVELTAPVQLGREELTRRILEDARKQVAQYGIELVDVRLKRVNYVQEVRTKVEERMISERQRIAEQFRSEGSGRSAEIIGEMQRDLAEIRSEAERRAEEIRGEADAKVTQIYGESYGQDPEFYAFFRTLESYPGTINNNTTLMLDGDSDFYKYLRSVGEGPEVIEVEAQTAE